MQCSFSKGVLDSIHHLLHESTFLLLLMLLLISPPVLLSKPARAMVAGITRAISSPLPDKPVLPIAKSCLRIGVDTLRVGHTLDGCNECVSARWHNIASIGGDEDAAVVAVRVVVVAGIVGMGVANWDSD